MYQYILALIFGGMNQEDITIRVREPRSSEELSQTFAVKCTDYVLEIRNVGYARPSSENPEIALNEKIIGGLAADRAEEFLSDPFALYKIDAACSQHSGSFFVRLFSASRSATDRIDYRMHVITIAPDGIAETRNEEEVEASFFWDR